MLHTAIVMTSSPGCRQELSMSVLKRTQIGHSVGVILPKEPLARFKLEKGDILFFTVKGARSRLVTRPSTSKGDSVASST